MTRPKPVRNAPVCQMDIQSLDAEGSGVGRLDGKVVFVAGALPGERVSLQCFETTPRYDRARLLSVDRPSSQRTVPPCPHAGVCGGCSLQHLDPLAQVAVKQRHLEDQLWHIGRIRPGQMLPPIIGPHLAYRSKARLSVRVPGTRGALVGFREYHSSFVAEITQCPILDPRVGKRILDLRALVARLEEPRNLPQIEIACTSDVAALVFRHLRPLSPRDQKLLGKFGQEHGLQIWLQGGGPETIHCIAPDNPAPLVYTIPEYRLRLRFAPLVFTQVNQSINPLLIRRAMSLLDPQPGENIVDLFCGLGNFTLPMAALGAEVLGVEGDARLTRLAAENAAENGLSDRAHFCSADLTQTRITDLLAGKTVRKMLIDPPRSGAIEVLKNLPPELQRLVYVSCNPDTLARDAAFLVHEGFRLCSAGVINMFPHTAHVESIALFTR